MKLNLKNLAYNIVMAFLLAVIVAPMLGANAAVVAGTGLFAVGCLLPAAPATAVPGLAVMAIQREIWTADIAENVFPDDAFFNRSRDDSANLSGRVVHVPQAGSTPNVEKNRTTLPAVVTKRIDTTADYTIDEFTTDPVLVQFTEQTEASYDKRSSVLFDHIMSLQRSVANGALYSWAPTAGANIIRSTGAARAAYKAFQSGNRLAITKNDFINAARVMNRMDVPQEGRVCVIDADLSMDIMQIAEFTQAQMIGTANLVNGSIARIMGFDVFVRSTTTTYDNSGTPVKKAAETATAVTDNLSVQFWHPAYVRFAKGGSANGGIEIFAQEQAPQFYGDVFSALVRAGGRVHRADQRGVVSLVESASA